MKLALRGLALLLLLLPCDFARAGGSGFVGNGGDGVELNGQLYLRDLWSLGLEGSAFVGTAIDSKQPLPPDSSSISFVYPQDLLTRKIADLNRACPGVGDYVLGSIKSYAWVLEDFPLTPIQDSDDPLLLPPGARLVQIANRFGNTIRIHAASFARLDDVNKVALIIHEAVYSLITPISSARLPADGTFAQPSYIARAITGSFFNSVSLAKSPELVLASLSGLAIPNVVLSIDTVRQKPSWLLRYGYLTGGDNNPDEVQAGKIAVDFSRPRSFQSLREVQASVCAKVEAIRLHPGHHDFWIAGDFQERPVTMSVRHYHASDTVDQTSITFVKQANRPDSSFYQYKNLNDCQSDFDFGINELLDGAWN